MTPKQEERIRTKIARIRKELAADKKRWGGFHHDGRGLRYSPPELFIKLQDYKGGLRYLRWFNRTFPDDFTFPIFLFQWTLILFKTNKLKEAEEKLTETHHSNTYLLNKFLRKDIFPIKKTERSSWELETAEHLIYKRDEPEFADFAEWVERFKNNEQFE